MGEKVSVVERPQARAVIGHGIDFPGDKKRRGKVAMESLVERLEAQ
jgi:hypothetical protein